MRLNGNSTGRRTPALAGFRCAAIVAGLALIAAAPAGAVAIIVPDDAPTIRAGIESGADEVLVRPGSYPETLLVDRPLTLRGLRDPASGEIPEAMGLTLDNTRQQATGGALVSDFHFRGPVRFAFHYPHPMGPLLFQFQDCVMDSGITDQPAIQWDQIGTSIARCRISGDVHLDMPQEAVFGNNIIRGGVQLHASHNALYVQGNSIEGPGACGIRGTFRNDLASIVGNTVRGFDVGIHLEGTYATIVRDNLVEECSQFGIVIHDDGLFSHEVVGNVLRSCGTAIDVIAAETLVLAGNVAEDCSSGLFATAGSMELTGNRVSECGTGVTIGSIPACCSTPTRPSNYTGVVSRGNRVDHCGGGINLLPLAQCTSDRDTVTDSAAGIRLEAADAPAVIDSAVVLSCGGAGIALSGTSTSATRCVVGRSVADGIQLTPTSTLALEGNTAFVNGGAGFAVHGPGPANGTVVRNIGFGNGSHGLKAEPGTTLALSCNDWFGNVAGATGGVSPGATDLALDPYFCNPHLNDVHLAPGSPLADAPGCGLIGALGSACEGGVTPTVVQLFAAERVAAGVRIRWRLAGDGLEISVERAPALVGPWSTIANYYAAGGEGVVLDTQAPQSPTWYRLTALEDRRVVAGPIQVAGAPVRFALARVGPVPAAGPIALELALPRAAAIELTVLDVQGRTVARLVRGEWPAGLHEIEWNGEGARGRLAPGFYLVRYRFPGGQDSRRVVISR